MRIEIYVCALYFYYSSTMEFATQNEREKNQFTLIDAQSHCVTLGIERNKNESHSINHISIDFCNEQ